jgi:Fungal trichothecene efflux pump (TRI12)
MRECVSAGVTRTAVPSRRCASAPQDEITPGAVDVPVGIAGLALAPVLLAESRDEHGQSHDFPGAALVTSGLVLLVLGITQGRQWEWLSGRTVGVFTAAAVLLAAFALWERRRRDPLVPFSIFKVQTLTAANVAGLIMGTALFSMFLMLTLYNSRCSSSRL